MAWVFQKKGPPELIIHAGKILFPPPFLSAAFVYSSQRLSLLIRSINTTLFFTSRVRPFSTGIQSGLPVWTPPGSHNPVTSLSWGKLLSSVLTESSAHNWSATLLNNYVHFYWAVKVTTSCCSLFSHLLVSDRTNAEAVGQAVAAPLITGSILGPHTLHLRVTLNPKHPLMLRLQCLNDK